MNYIRQRRAFRAFKNAHIKQISLRAIAAWDALFDVLNDLEWPEGYVQINKYELLASFPASEETLRRAMDELCDLGLIRMQRETRSTSACYEMIVLYEEDADEQQGARQDERRISADSAQIRRRFGAKTGGICGEPEETQASEEKILTIDRACACARPKPNVNQNVNINVKENEEDEETRARRAGTPAGGEGYGQTGEAAARGGEARTESRGKAAQTGRTCAECEAEPLKRKETVERCGSGLPEIGEFGRAIAEARACGFSMSKRTREHIAALCAAYGVEWVCSAIGRAAMRGADKCNVGYVTAILSRWTAAGGMDEPGAGANKNTVQYAGNGQNYGGYTGKKCIATAYNQRTYTAEEDNALFTDLFADENG